MLNEFLFTKIKNKYIGKIWFQQDGAACHTAEATLNVLRPVFEDRIISRRADVIWPPRSYDLTPLDYYLWGAVKDKCYANKPETIDALNYNICEAIGEIQLHVIDNVLKNWTDHVGLPRQPFQWNYFLLLTGRIVLSNKKRNLRKYSVIFLKHFPKKNLVDLYLISIRFQYTVVFITNIKFNWLLVYSDTIMAIIKSWKIPFSKKRNWCKFIIISE